MSKNIWHTTDKTPKKDRVIVVKSKRTGEYLVGSEFEFILDNFTKWAYFDDLLTLENKLIRTRKELDIRKKQVEIANKAFDFINTEWDNVDCSRKELGACAFNAKEDIAGWESDVETALEQKD